MFHILVILFFGRQLIRSDTRVIFKEKSVLSKQSDVFYSQRVYQDQSYQCDQDRFLVESDSLDWPIWWIQFTEISSIQSENQIRSEEIPLKGIPLSFSDLWIFVFLAQQFLEFSLGSPSSSSFCARYPLYRSFISIQYLPSISVLIVVPS